MTRSMTVKVKSRAVPPSKAITAAARMAPLLIPTGRAFRDLAVEPGSDEAAMRHLLRVSENVGRPIGCNFQTAEGSRTAVLAPRSWTQDRLRGWIAAKHEESEGAFGKAVAPSLEDL